MMKNIMLKNLNQLTFLDEINDIISTKSESYYYKIFNINLDGIKNFINNIGVNEIYLINPLISVSCIPESPYLNLSEPFLVTNKSNPYLIYNFLNQQLEIALEDFGCEDINEGHNFLIIKYEMVTLNNKFDLNND
jgi:hypothetical protein